MTDLVLALFLCAASPLAVGLLLGIDRRITARMQNRVGPPLLQPFYDLFKLFGKERSATNIGQTTFAMATLVLQAAALVLFAFGGDLLIIFFVSSAGTFAFVLGAFSSRSPYSQLGAHRELLQVLAYEPVLFLFIFFIGWRESSFSSFHVGDDLILSGPLVLGALFLVLLIKMQKSPFDVATAHQEIVSGPYVEYSGLYLGILKLAHWFELAVMFGLITLMFGHDDLAISWLGKGAIVAAMLFLAILVDNSTARVVRERMVLWPVVVGMALIGLNMLAIYVWEVMA